MVIMPKPKPIQNPNNRTRPSLSEVLKPMPGQIGSPARPMPMPGATQPSNGAIKTGPNPNGMDKFNPIVGQPVTALLQPGGDGAVKTGPNPYGNQKFNPNVGQPVHSLLNPGDGGAVKTGPHPYGNQKFNPIVGQPVTTFSNPVNSGAVKPGSNPNGMDKFNPVVGQPVNAYSSPVQAAGMNTMSATSNNGSGLNQQTINEIIKKAQQGIPLVNSTPEKMAIYNQYYKAPSTPTNTQPNQGNVASPTTQPIANWNSNQSVPDYGGMTPGMIEQILKGYTSGGSSYYDPNSDPVYQSMMQLANKQADLAGLSTMEDMNERGILNSTITSDRVGQIKQGASDAVLSQIPNLSQNFMAQQSNNQAGLMGLLNTVLGAGQFQQTFAEGNRQFDKNFSLDEANVTGRYMSPEAQQALSIILDTKQQSSKGGLTAAQREENGKKATQARNLLASMGFDISGLASNVGYDQALQSSQYLGRNTLGQQAADLDKTQVMGKNTSTVAQGLIQRVLTAKKDSENKVGDKKSNNQIAEQSRQQLQAMGFDVSGIGSNVSYAQALKNAAKIGGQTLEAKNSEADRTLAKTQFNREMNYKEQLALIESDLASRGLDIEEVKNQVSLFNAQSDADYQLHLKQMGIDEQTATVNTQRAIEQTLRAETLAEALDYITRSGLANSGANMTEVLRALEYKFPEFGALDGGNSSSPTYRNQQKTTP